jgi:rubrerythrin
VGKMYSAEDSMRTFRKDLDFEFDAIKFYLDNLKDMNYKENKEKLVPLILDSVKHAEIVINEILKLNHGGGKLNKTAQELAMKEEEAMRGIYEYELEKTKDPERQRTLKSLIAQEKHHEDLVRSLR